MVKTNIKPFKPPPTRKSNRLIAAGVSGTQSKKQSSPEKTISISESRTIEEEMDVEKEVNSKTTKPKGKVKFNTERDEESSKTKPKGKRKLVETEREECESSPKKKLKKIVIRNKTATDQRVEVRTVNGQMMASVVKNKEQDIKSKKKANNEVVVWKKKEMVEDSEEDAGKYEPVNLMTRISPTNLKNVIGNCTPGQYKLLEEMGFGDYCGEFNFESTPTALGMWLCKNFDASTSTLVLSENRKILVTKELIHEILGIPMGELKVQALRETTTADATTVKWRSTLPLSVYDPDATTASQKKIPISRLEAYLSTSTDESWAFKVGFLVVFFSIFAHGNKDGSVNQRFIPAIEDIEVVPKLDWCSYCLECMKKELKDFKARSFFAGPVLLLALIYVNSTVSEKTVVNRTLPAFKAWSTKLLKQRENEECKGGFGKLPILQGMQLIETPKKAPKKNLKKQKNKVQETEENASNTMVQLYTPQLDLSRGLYGTMSRDEELQLFKTKSKKEMIDCLKDILEKSKEMMIRTDDKLKIAFSSYTDDEEIKKVMEERNMLYKESYIVGDKGVNVNISDGVVNGDDETDKLKADDGVVPGKEECHTKVVNEDVDEADKGNDHVDKELLIEFDEGGFKENSQNLSQKSQESSQEIIGSDEGGLNENSQNLSQKSQESSQELIGMIGSDEGVISEKVL